MIPVLSLMLISAHTDELNVCEVDISGDASHTETSIGFDYVATAAQLTGNTVRSALLTVPQSAHSYV